MAVPTVPTITSPTDGATVSGTVTVTWTASTLPGDPPTAAFTWVDAPYTPVDPPTAGFTWSDEDGA